MRARIRKILLLGALLGSTIYAVCAIQSNTVTDIKITPPQSLTKTESVISVKPEPVTSPVTKRTVSTETKTEVIQKPTVPIINVSFSAGSYSATTTVSVNSSVYGLMNSLKSKGFIFNAKYFGSGMGYFINEINKVPNDEKGATYWTLYVNGKESPLGASSYILKENDSVSWKFENRLNPVR